MMLPALSVNYKIAWNIDDYEAKLVSPSTSDKFLIFKEFKNDGEESIMFEALANERICMPSETPKKPNLRTVANCDQNADSSELPADAEQDVAHEKTAVPNCVEAPSTQTLSRPPPDRSASAPVGLAPKKGNKNEPRKIVAQKNRNALGSCVEVP